MTRKEELLILARQFHAHVEELSNETNWKFQLQHLQECQILYRRISEALALVENRIALDFNAQTGHRAVHPIWKKLPRPPPPPEKK